MLIKLIYNSCFRTIKQTENRKSQTFSAPVGANSEVSSSDSCLQCQDDLECRDHGDLKRESPASTTESGKPYLKFSVSAILSKCQQQQQQQQQRHQKQVRSLSLFFLLLNRKALCLVVFRCL